VSHTLQVMNSKLAVSDRFYRALYALLLSPQLCDGTAAHALFLNLLYKVHRLCAAVCCCVLLCAVCCCVLLCAVCCCVLLCAVYCCVLCAVCCCLLCAAVCCVLCAVCCVLCVVCCATVRCAVCPVLCCAVFYPVYNTQQETVHDKKHCTEKTLHSSK
jgi:hypothetical protein